MISILSSALDYRVKPSVWNGEVFRIAEHKYDGHRVMLVRDTDGTFHAIGRKERINLADRLRLRKEMEFFFNFLPGTAIDGELYVEGEGMRSNDMSAALANRNHGKLRFRGFAPYYVMGSRLYGDSSVGFEQTYLALSSCGVMSPSRLETHGATPNDTVLLSYINEHRLEGLVLKADPWHCWWKLKPIQTVDAIVLEVLEGVSRNSGRLGSLKIGVIDGSGGIHCLGNVGTGFSDSQRDAFWRDDGIHEGDVVEVSFDSVGARGKLRFPRFIRLRTDKPSRECVIGQIKELAER